MKNKPFHMFTTVNLLLPHPLQASMYFHMLPVCLCTGARL